MEIYQFIYFSDLLFSHLLRPFLIEVCLLDLLLEFFNLLVFADEFICLSKLAIFLLLSFVKFSSKFFFGNIEIDTLTLGWLVLALTVEGSLGHLCY